MKKYLGMCLAIVVIFSCLVPCANGDYADMPKPFSDEEEFWEMLSEYSPNDILTAGVMGFFYRESRLKADSVAGWPARDYGFDTSICETFTKLIDMGLEDGSSRDVFIEAVNIHFGGYGLGQWSNVQYLEHFYDFMKDKGGSIGDARLQCEFIFESLKLNEALWEDLLECTTAFQCGRRIGYKYDGTNDLGAETIASVADIYYRRFHDG